MLNQENWRWCNKCQGLIFGGGGAERPCPSGGEHRLDGSGNYFLIGDNPFSVDQDNWRWCTKCFALCFAGADAGPCPAGGTHDHTGSSNYKLLNEDSTIPGQDNWRWCQKCQMLAFAGGGSGPCPAGGAHGHGVSGNYKLLQVGQAVQRARLVLTRLTCYRTTEDGHDEVYYVAGGVDGSGQKVSHRGPDAANGGDADGGTAWDMNDSGDKKDRTLNATLYEGSLKTGEVANVAIGLCESDGTDVGQVLKAAGELASKIPDRTRR
jgi:hypothetical protein